MNKSLRRVEVRQGEETMGIHIALDGNHRQQEQKLK
jgi:hypothetical protein